MAKKHTYSATPEPYLFWSVLCLLIASFVLTRVYDFYRILAVFVFALLFWLIYKKSKLNPNEIGMDKDNLPAGLKWGFGVMSVVGLVIAIALAIKPELFMDTRYHESLSSAVFKAVFFIPFATVLFEEIVFRGILLALLIRQYSTKVAVAANALLFGLWHIFSSANATNTIIDGSGTGQRLAGILTVLLATSSAGLVLCLLRLKSRSVIAPILAHWSINSFALIAAAIAWR